VVALRKLIAVDTEQAESRRAEPFAARERKQMQESFFAVAFPNCARP
jgi:hypothetical protein